MTAAISKYGMKYALKRVYKNSRNDPANKSSKYDDWDPKYEWVKNPRNGKWKKVKKDLSYVPKHDLAIYNKVRSRAVLLDSYFNFGIGRAGLSSVIGFIPGIGDVSDLILACYIWNMCAKVDGGLSGSEHKKMAQNIVIDVAMGLVPIIGDIADTAFKANIRNLKVLEEHLEKKYGATAKSKRHQRSAGDDYYSDDDTASTPPRRHDRRGRRNDSLDYDRSFTSRDMTPPSRSRRRGDADRRDLYVDEELGRRDTQRSSRRRGY